jgi:two-component system response regulator YesN
MLKILIVDDEPLILKGLIHIIQNADCISTEIVSAIDGLDALEKLADFQPDLIITDLYMPEMNGFEFIEKLQNMGILKRFIILTGYDDFELVRKALRYKTIDYLLKPVDQDELIEIMIKVSEDLKVERTRQDEHELLMIQEMMLYNVPIEELIFNHSRVAELFPFQQNVAIVIQFHEAMDLNVVKGIRDEALQRYEKKYAFTSTYKNQWIFLLNVTCDLDDNERMILHKTIMKYEGSGSRFDIGIAQHKFNLPFINHLYSNALKNLFYNKHVLQQFQFNFNDRNDAAGDSFINELIDAISMNNSHDVSDKLQTYIQKLTLGCEKDVQYIKRVYIKILSDMSVHMQKLGVAFEKVFPIPVNYESVMDEISDFKQLENKVFEAANAVLEYFIKDSSKSNYSKSIKKILNFVEMNYQNDISLENIADVVKLHPNYISILFKKETGVTFVRYLHTFRMNKAKDIIFNDPEIAFSKVACMVGYENPGHFFKIFKKFNGITPGQFRDLRSTH